MAVRTPVGTEVEIVLIAGDEITIREPNGRERIIHWMDLRADNGRAELLDELAIQLVKQQVDELEPVELAVDLARRLNKGDGFARKLVAVVERLELFDEEATADLDPQESLTCFVFTRPADEDLDLDEERAALMWSPNEAGGWVGLEYNGDALELVESIVPVDERN